MNDNHDNEQDDKAIVQSLANDIGDEPQVAVEPILNVVFSPDSGFVVTINGNQDPIVVAGIAWYLERMASRGLAVLEAMEQAANQQTGGTVFGPDGVTPIPLNRQQRRHPTSH